MDNHTAIGYVIKALQELGYQEQHIQEVEVKMLDVFDTMTEDEAKELYRKF